jgi:hypothetical protein
MFNSQPTIKGIDMIAAPCSSSTMAVTQSGPTPQAGTKRLLPVLTVLTLTLACASSWALPVFTLNPAGSSAALNGTSVTADNIIVSDFSHVVINSGTGGFTDTGFLSVQSFQLAGSVVASPGLNSTYGLYIGFSGTGTQTLGNPFTTFTSGNFETLDYTLYGYNGPTASFGFDAANNPTTTASGAVALASGSLLQGTVSTSPATSSYSPSANASVTFNVAAGQSAFFVDPAPFYNAAFAAFTNTTSQVDPISPTEFTIRQGGGAFNFAPVSAVPEPQTYALMLAGLAAVGYTAKRRKI